MASLLTKLKTVMRYTNNCKGVLLVGSAMRSIIERRQRALDYQSSSSQAGRIPRHCIAKPSTKSEEIDQIPEEVNEFHRFWENSDFRKASKAAGIASNQRLDTLYYQKSPKRDYARTWNEYPQLVAKAKGEKK